MRIRNSNTQTKFKPFVNYGYDSTAHKMRETQLKINQKLLLALNKNIKNSTYQKVNDNMGQANNSSISYNFAVNNRATFLNNNFNFNNSFSHALKGGAGLAGLAGLTGLTGLTGLVGLAGLAGLPQNSLNIETTNQGFIGLRLPLLNFVFKVINSFFNTIGCICSKPQFIQHHDRLIIRLFYYELNKAHFKNVFSTNLLNIKTPMKISLDKDSSSVGLLNTNFYNSLYNNINQNNKSNYVLNTGLTNKKVLQSLLAQKILNYFKKNNKENSLNVLASARS